MCASYSGRKYFRVVSTGVTAASPKAHNVLPAMLFEHQHRDRRPAGDDGFEPAPVARATGAPFDELAQRDRHRRFVNTRPLDLTADAVQLGPAVFLGPERGKPLGPIAQDERHVAE